MAEHDIDPTGAVVSSEDEPLILVDDADREIGHLSKGECHDGAGVLHRAFSLFVFNPEGELLLQQRSADKRLWPLYWSNSCCSHPRRGETMELATGRRLAQELGMSADLDYLFKFQYRAQFDGLGSEHELCWVFAGTSHDEPRPNVTEVAAVRWVSPDELDREFETNSAVFTPWFTMEWPRVKRHL
ncbi:MAG: isopentenyl-diphosphate Delta-isomerase [Holophagae bacterium]